MGYLDLNGLSHYHTKLINLLNTLIPTKVSTLTNDSGYVTQASVDTALGTAKTYSDSLITNLVGTAPETMDTIYELAQSITDNKDLIDALESAVTNVESIATTDIDTLFTS